MTNSLQIAKLILAKTNSSMNTVKLQKLVYYCQAWHATALDRPLFEEQTQAWEHGPVVRELWDQHRYQRRIEANEIQASIPALPQDSDDVIDDVLAYYNKFTAWELEDLTHDEAPWKAVYQPKKNVVITVEKMKSFYSGRLARNEEHPKLRRCIYTYVEQDEFQVIEEAIDDETPSPALVEALKRVMSR